MKYYADAAGAGQIDAISSGEYNIPPEILMERAAYAAAEYIKKHAGRHHKILAVAGRGSNGGDALAIARILHEDGYEASLYVSRYEKVSELLRMQYDIACASGVPVMGSFAPEDFDIIIDGLFGIGLNRDVSGVEYSMIEKINATDAKVFSVDIPSGISADTGNVMGIAIKAYATITFGTMKTGLLLAPGYEYAGNVHVAKAGFPAKALDSISRNNFYYDRDDLCLLPKRHSDSNKGTYGKLLVIAGSYGMSGAARLCASAAYHSGCGLVRILTDKNNLTALQTGVPEAIVSCYDAKEGLPGKDDIINMLAWADVIAIGPGLGTGEVSSELLDIVINNAEAPMVIDADAINLLAKRQDYENAVKNAIITPHLKEMSGLTKIKIEDIRSDMAGFAADHSTKDVILVLKNSRTVVSDGENIYINTSGNDGMATAGSGDVLTGIIASFMAQGLDRYTAATLGVYVHGLAGDAAAARIGRYALTATAIIDSLGEVLI